MKWATALLACALCGASLATASSASAEAFRIDFHVARENGAPVVDSAWIDRAVAGANQLFGPYDVHFVRGETIALSGDADIVSRSDRHRLGEFRRPNVVNCFIVQSLKDVDVEDRFIRGVHWRSRTHRNHYVILSSIAGQLVLAHELGHFFGNHQHSDTPGNIMSYERGDGPPFFDAQQVEVIRRHVRHFLRNGELRLVAQMDQLVE